MSDVSERDAARGVAARALRELGHTLVQRDGDPELLLRIAEAADRVTAELAEAPTRQRDAVSMKRAAFDAGDSEMGDFISHFDECFVSGAHNPMGIGMRVKRAGAKQVQAQVELGSAFEGAPRRAHGGIVAAVFDDVLGYLLSVTRTAAFTGQLTVRYLAPTPLGEALTITAHEVSRKGRKITTDAIMTAADGRPIAEATALFITVDPSNFKP